MNASDREAYRRRYQLRLEKYGHDPRSLGWDSGRQEQRFRSLTSFCALGAVASVLDVGCGFGDLYPFLLQNGFQGNYTGVDFIRELLEVGRSSYPGANFIFADFSELHTDRTFDLVVASGIFNVRLSDEDQWLYLSQTLAKMFSLCKVATAADFLTSYVDYRRDDLYFTSPEQVFSFSKSLTRRVALSHAYLPFEFTICLYKDDRIAENASFYRLPGRSF